jgi:ligand-binding SRPBCC domain-containing protein
VKLERILDVDAPIEVLWAFHERPDALRLLSPPWERIEIIQPPRSLAVGTRVIVRAWLGPIPMTIEAEHFEYERGRLFADRMNRGPFKSFVHRHRFELRGTRSRLVDDIEYELPGGALGRLIGGAIAKRRLDRLFAYRHEVTRAACEEVR